MPTPALEPYDPPATPPPRPSVPAIKPLPSVIPKKPGDPRNTTMLGMTPLKRPARLEATPAPVAMPAVARDVEVKLPPTPRPARPTPGTDDSDDQTTGVASRFAPDTAFPDECKVCHFPMREHQAAEFAKDYRGEIRFGPSTTIDEEYEIAEEMIQREAHEKATKLGLILPKPSIIVPRGIK
jgi:hypothetical protein